MQKSACRRRLVSVFLLMAGALSLAAPALAEYPDRPIKLVVAYPPGGATDVTARAVAQRLSERLKQAVVVENRAGAAGMIGTDYVAKAAPDGYTIMFTAADTHSINPHVYPKITYDARKDFTPVAQVGSLPIALIVSPQVQAKNVAEFLALARKNPGKMTYASFGVGSSGHVAMEMLNIQSRVELLHVPYQGAAPAIAALMAGQVDAMMVPLVLAVPNDAAGKVRLLGAATPTRFAGAPNAPTFAEQGIPLNSAPWVGILAPAKVPQDIVEKLNRELNAALQDPQVRETLIKNGLDPATSSQPAFRALLDAEYDRWGKTITAANIKVN
ncbi:MAG: tripartite tricarboxylate transporter substrate binding protein [Polaromonas sp.]|uniref:Bug family tripartite tricarboxylate transporter substrate binding protein n=1 Tax=Polaromonas sp. TaxID=1869339 RepID=UPI0025E4AB9F|nr:tripartite tricarboxylate transporter substrate binding protein [Polaromonas sp.]MBI2727736.1 tripartite tricarboxylate transporter substrate binding protein [Polaromonas sp.]